ncbi:MAG TPA: extracellular solute-binding protein, partial [Anaerolineales bacterium]|nr:extracellular solute-binding protein [Anaerolineales bacterium]
TLLDSPEAVGAADFYTSFRKDKIGAIPADVGEGWQGTVFGKGQCAMVYEGGWLIPYLAQSFPDLKYGVALPPSGPKGEGNLIFTVSWSISKNTKNPDAAWKVIDFLTNADSQKTVLESGFALPTRMSLQGSDYLTKNPAAATIFNGSLHGAQPFYWGPVGNDVNDQMGKALERIFLNGEASDASLKEAAEAIRKSIAQSQ